MDACIKNIGEEDWRTFKAESAHHGMKMGKFFNTLIHEHEERCTKSNWNKILHGKKPLKGILTRNEGRKIREEFRKGFATRIS